MISRAQRWAAGAFACAVLLALSSAMTVVDADLWGHLRYGLDLLASRTIPRTDVYSWTAHGQAWINHEWLFELLMAIAWQAAGAAGLLAVKHGAVVLVTGLSMRHLLRSGSPALGAALAVTAVLGWSMPWYGPVRPQLATFVALACLLSVLSTTRARRARLLLLVPLFALWVNLHGGVLFGVAVLGTWLLGESLDDHACRGSASDGLLTAGACTAALLVNPYGWHLPLALIDYAWPARPDIAEWTPMAGVPVLTVVHVSLAALGAWRVRGAAAQRVGRAALVVVAAALPFAAIRHYPLASLLWLFIVAPPRAAGHAAPQTAVRASTGRGGVAWSFVVASTCAMLVLAWRSSGLSYPAGRYPTEAVEWLQSQHARGRMVVWFDYGQYVIWHLGPEVLVSIDGRRETVYPPEIRTRQLAFEDDGAATDLLAQDVDYVLVAGASRAAATMRRLPDWRVVVERPTPGGWVLFARAAVHAAPAIAIESQERARFPR